MMRALLIRHAETTGQAPDALLTPGGYAQAERLAVWLATQNAGPLYTSPYMRAKQTLEPFANASGQSLTSLDGLRERVLSPTPLPNWKEHLAQSFADGDHACQGGESMNDVRARARAALTVIAQSGGALPAFVTHGGVTSALFSAIDAAFGFEASRGLRNPDVFDVTLKGANIIAYQRIEWETQA